MLLSDASGPRQDRHGVLIVGSGYGGAVTAARLAQAGHQVAILERGREWSLGEFPQDAVSGEREIMELGNPLGLYHYSAGDVDVFSGSGLGGTSLINAGVVLQPLPTVFQGARWPREIRRAAELGQLQPFFDRAAAILEVDTVSPESEPIKTATHELSAKVRGRPFARAPLSINLRRYDGAPNLSGVTQKLCIGCGNCVAGCNVGAKNAVTMNYLPRARAAGAEIFTQVEVDYLLPAPEGWFVFARHRARADQPPTARVLHARTVILAAGALGSTGILLRSRARGLALSPRLGHSFSSNGDFLGIAYDTEARTNDSGFDYAAPPADYQVGPFITSYIDYRQSDPNLGFIVQDGAVPRSLVDLLRRFIPEIALAGGTPTTRGFGSNARALGRLLRDQLRNDPLGALNSSQVYLGMGHDGADGKVVLDANGAPKVIWGGAGRRPLFQQIDDELLELARTLSGTYIANPRWWRSLGNVPITAHPLGGCPMGDDSDGGVVDHRGRVFDEAGAIHPGLFVADGSLLPTSLAVNPLFTISAISERIADAIVAEHQYGEKLAPVPPTALSFVVPDPPAVPVGLEFTEELKGYVSASDTRAQTAEQYRAAEELGHQRNESLAFKVTIFIEDLARFIANPAHLASAEGYVDSTTLGERLTITRGAFNLYLVDPGRHDKRMVYSLAFHSDKGAPYLLTGIKEISDAPAIEAWAENTTLYTTLHSGSSPDDPVVAQGRMHLTPVEFLRQLSTFRVRNCDNELARLSALKDFGVFFFGELWESYVQHRVPGADKQ